jgi:hypothetical protein
MAPEIRHLVATIKYLLIRQFDFSVSTSDLFQPCHHMFDVCDTIVRQQGMHAPVI